MASQEKNSWILIQEKKRDMSLRVLVDECLSCTLYEEVFLFSQHDWDTCICLIWPTSDQACVSKIIQIYFWIWCSQKSQLWHLWPLQGITRMAGKVWEKCLRNRVKLTLYYVNNPCMAGEILAKALSCMTGESYDGSCAVNLSHYGRKVWSSY